MSKKSRYFLLLAGFLFFLLAAPAVVLYVRGINYDFSKHAFITTGILAVRTNPSSADIFLDDKLKRQKEGDIKFLLPKEYQTKITKDGYFSWEKRLTVLPGQVTWASPAFNSVFLLLKDQPAQILAQQILDLSVSDNKTIFLTTDRLFISSKENISNSQNYPLTFPVTKIFPADDTVQNFILTASDQQSPKKTILWFNIDSQKLADIGAAVSANNFNRFSSNGNLFSLDQQNLYSIDSAQNTKSLLFNKILAFGIQQNDLYLLKNNATSSSLLISQPPYKNSQLLINNLPLFSQAKLFITYEKQVFLWADNSLYLVNSSLEKIADNVSSVDYQPQTSTLAIISSGEINFYDTLRHNLNYVTRNSEPVSNLVIRKDIGYAFYIKNQTLTAIELDGRDNQNEYVLYQGNGLTKFFIDPSGKNILLLDDKTVKSLKIR